MIQKFEDFINEAKGTPKFKNGDMLRVLPDVTGKVDDYGNDHAFNNIAGMIVEVVEVDDKQKWTYKCRLVNGCYIASSRKHPNPHLSDFYKLIFTEDQLTTDDVNKFMGLLKKAEYDKKDKIVLTPDSLLYPMGDAKPIKAGSNVTKVVYAVAVEQTLKFNEPCYILDTRPYSGGYTAPTDKDKGAYKQSDISNMEEVAENAISHIAKAVGDKAKMKAHPREQSAKDMPFSISAGHPVYDFNASSLTLEFGKKHSLFKSGGFLVFPTTDDRNSFMSEFEKLIEKYSTKELIAITKASNTRYPVVNTDIKETDQSEADDIITVRSDRMVDIAKDLDIDIKKIVSDNIGDISMKNLGF